MIKETVKVSPTLELEKNKDGYWVPVIEKNGGEMKRTDTVHPDGTVSRTDSVTIQPKTIESVQVEIALHKAESKAAMYKFFRDFIGWAAICAVAILIGFAAAIVKAIWNSSAALSAIISQAAGEVLAWIIYGLGAVFAIGLLLLFAPSFFRGIWGYFVHTSEDDGLGYNQEQQSGQQGGQANITVNVNQGEGYNQAQRIVQK